MSFLVPPDGGTFLGGSFEISVKVRSEQTGGAMAVLEETIAPGALIAPHTHENDVWVYVLSGEIGVLVGEETGSAAAGWWALKPRGVLHSMWNSGTDPARLIEVLTPGGSEQWFEEISALDSGDSDAFDAACARYGIAFVPQSEWNSTLRARFT